MYALHDHVGRYAVPRFCDALFLLSCFLGVFVNFEHLSLCIDFVGRVSKTIKSRVSISLNKKNLIGGVGNALRYLAILTINLKNNGH